MLSSEKGLYCPLSQKNLLRTENIPRNFTGLKLIFSASLAHKDSNNYVAMDRSYHHFSMIGGIYNLSSLSIAFRQWLSMKWHVMAVKNVYYLGINLYAKGNLSLNYNKPISAHDFSAIRRFLWGSSTMSMKNSKVIPHKFHD